MVQVHGYQAVLPGKDSQEVEGTIPAPRRRIVEPGGEIHPHMLSSLEE